MSSLRLIVTRSIAAFAITACHRQSAGDDHTSHMSGADKAAPRAVASASARDMSLPPSNNNAKARLAATPRHAEWVKVAWEPGSPDSLMAWIVYPSTSNAKTPVVVVVHEIFGLSSWVRGVADQVAADGFIAIAPDLLSIVRGGPSETELTSDSANKIQRGVPNSDKIRGVSA